MPLHRFVPGCGPQADPTARRLVPAVLAALVLAAQGTSGHAQESHAQEAAETHPADDFVVIEAEDFAFDAPDEIDSGWNTLRYVNTGEEPHLLFIARLPEGLAREDYEVEIIRAFDVGWQQLRAGELGPEEALGEIMGGLPEWFGQVEFLGGTGVVEPDDTAEVTLDLPAGTYVIECYMKTEDGELHSMEGMVRELTVTDTPSPNFPPYADVEITLSNFAMEVEGELTPGRQTVAVHVEEHPAEGFGHNVHVAREEEAPAEDVLRWLNFLEIDGLAPPAPYTFLGGMHILPEGETGYFTLDVEPGRHLFLSEFTGFEGVFHEILVDP